MIRWPIPGTLQAVFVYSSTPAAAAARALDGEVLVGVATAAAAARDKRAYTLAHEGAVALDDPSALESIMAAIPADADACRCVRFDAMR